MAGNRLGPRVKIVYESEETGVGYILETDADLVVAGAGPGGAAPELYDPQSPPVGLTICPSPKRFKPRRVFAQSSTDGARKTIICSAASANLYATSQSKAVPAIDGDSTFVTTGRKGEALTF